METIELINAAIRGVDSNQVSDGYHTFGELYEHRIALFIALCKIKPYPACWRSQLHHDGSAFEGWFIMGIGKDRGEQISYHLPMSKWEETRFAHTVKYAPEWDGHSGEDVLQRLKDL